MSDLFFCSKGGRIIKKFLINLVIILLALIIQLIIPPDFIFSGVRADLLLVISLTIGLYWGINDGMGFAFLAGILQGVFLGASSGIYIVVKTLLGGLAGFIGKIYFKEKFLFPPIIIFFLTFLHETLIILLSEKLLFNIDYLRALRVVILPEAILNTIIGIFIYYLYYKLWQVRGYYYEK